MSGHGRRFIICMWNAAVRREDEGLTLPGMVSLEILFQASSLWSSGSKYSSPFFALLWSQKPDICALPLWAPLPLVSRRIQQGECPQIGGRERGERVRLGYYSLQGRSDWPWPLSDGHRSCQAVIPNSTLSQSQVSIPHLPLSGLGAGRTCPTHIPLIISPEDCTKLCGFSVPYPPLCK